MSYENHDFYYERNSEQPSVPIDVTGFLITEDGYTSQEYEGHDFVDTSKDELIVEVAGGLCNIPLGQSRIRITFQSHPDCYWLVSQSGYKRSYPDTPAQ